MATNDDLLRELQKITAAISKKGPAGTADDAKIKEQQAAKEERKLLEAKKQALIDEGASKEKILEINRQLAESSERLAAAFGQEATHRAALSRETERATEKQKEHN